MAMICPPFIPGETVYSWVAQYHLMSPYGSWKQVNRKLFGTTNVRLNPVMPSHVRDVAMAAHVNPYRLLIRGTAFPLFSLGLQSSNQIIALREAMFGSGGMRLAALSRQASSKIDFGVKLKCCAECLEKDEDQYGVGYWHTEHQLHGVTVCPDHKIKLDIIQAGEGGIGHSYILPSEDLIEPQTAPFPREVYLSCFIVDLHLYLTHYTPDEPLRQRFLQSLVSNGYVTPNGQLRWQVLQRDLREFWGELFHKNEPVIPYSLSQFKFVPSLVHREVGTHYIKLVLLMAFLSGTPKQFFEKQYPPKNITLPKPIGNPTEPNNQIALSLLKQQISLRQVSNKTGFSVGYLKQLALRNRIPVQRRRKRISSEIERSIWRQAFMGFHRVTIAQNHNVSIAAVEDIIQSHEGLPAWRKHIRFANKLRLCRTALMDYMRCDPSASRNKIIKHVGSIYRWLYQHDKEWLYTHLPPGVPRCYRPKR